jgi:hypothetical protein
MTIPAALVAHDTRLWTGSFEDTYPDGFLQNLGTAPSEDGVYNWQVPVYDTSPSYFSPYASNTQINSYPELARGPPPPHDPVRWDELGGPPESAVFTYILSIGDLANAGVGGTALGQMIFGSNFGVYFNQDSGGYQVFVADPTAGSDTEIDYNVATPLTNTMIFAEQDFTGSTPTAKLWIGTTLVATSSSGAAYSTLDADYPAANVFYIQYGFGNIALTAGDPFPIIGGAFLREALDDAGRLAWQSYFFPVAAPVPIPFEYMDRWQNMQDDPDWWERAEYRDIELEDYLAGLAAQVAALTAIVEAL